MSTILFWTLGDAALRSTLAAIFVAVILAVLRTRTGALRHAAWTAVLCTMLLMPFAARWTPALTIPVPLPAASSATAFVLGDTVSRPDTAAGNAHGAGGATTGPSESRVTAPPAAPPAEPPFRLTSTSTSGPESASSVRTAADKPHATPRPWLLVSLVLYGLGGLVSSFRYWMGSKKAARVASAATPIELPIGYGVQLPGPLHVPVRESSEVVSPVTVGAFQPTILLPATWTAWSGHTLRAVLAHELAHVRRRDPLVRLLAHVNRCLFWFHPLAWWLERTLAAAAEHASDDEAVRAIGEPARYAGVLIEMARAIRENGGRLAREGVGIDGDLLGRRIDRILDGDAWRAASRRRQRTTAVSCVAAIVLAIACRPQLSARRDDSAAIEQRDRQLRAELRQLLVERSEDVARIDWPGMPQQRQELAVSLDRNPEDLGVLKRLLIDEWMRPSPPRRAHILWLIEHHPDDRLAGSLEARIFPKDVEHSNLRGIERSSLAGDAVGYERAKALWLAHASRPDVSARALENASRFFEEVDNPLAEQMLLQARARDPRGPWSARLGRLYALTLAGSSVLAAKNRVLSLSAGEPATGYGEAVRKKLGESTDDVLLTAAGWFLRRAPGRLRSAFEPDPAAWAEWCFKRALQINPKAVLAHTALLELRQRSRGGEPLWRVPPASLYESVSALPEPERFEQLPTFARSAYATLEELARWDDPNLRDRVELARRNARRFAEDALTLAPKYRTHPEYGTAIYLANMTLGSLALRDGDKHTAVAFLRKASAARSSETLAYANDIVSGLHWHLASDLLKQGERNAVTTFLDRMAAINVAGRTDLREAAAAIRRGETPRL